GPAATRVDDLGGEGLSGSRPALDQDRRRTLGHAREYSGQPSRRGTAADQGLTRPQVVEPPAQARILVLEIATPRDQGERRRRLLQVEGRDEEVDGARIQGLRTAVDAV